MVITISRQYGSGGRELAQKVAEKLNIKLYDRQIIHLAAAQIGINDLSEENLRELENNVSPLSLGFIPFFNLRTISCDAKTEYLLLSFPIIIPPLKK